MPKNIYRLAMDFKSKESMKKFIDELVAQGDLGDVAIYPMDALHEKNKTEKYIVRGYEAGNGINPLSVSSWKEKQYELPDD